MTNPKERLARFAAPTGPFGWQEVLAMRETHGINVTEPEPGCSLSARVIQRLVSQRRAASPVPLFDLFYDLRAEYLHLTHAQRTAKLPGLVLEAFNDPYGGIQLVPLTRLVLGSPNELRVGRTGFRGPELPHSVTSGDGDNSTQSPGPASTPMNSRGRTCG